MKAAHWKRLESSEVLSHPRIHLIEDTVELPDGKLTKYIRHAPYKNHAVIIIAINNKGDVLVQKEYSYPPDVIMWQLPGGSMKDGEDVLQAANRELSEESGFVADSSKQIGFFMLITGAQMKSSMWS